jgi:hypothetical protein
MAESPCKLSHRCQFRRRGLQATLVRKCDSSAEYHDIANANYDRGYPPEPALVYDEILLRHCTRHESVCPQQA